MGLNQFWVPLVMVILLARWRCDGCWENEKRALLELKDYLNYPDGNAMSSWERTPNCCYWEYVECDPITKRVTSLYPWRDGKLGDWYLNTSVFLPFEELNDLSLEDINIMGCVQNEGFERLRRLGNLEHLDLSDNKFNNSILPSLSRLSSLKSLTLDNNELKGIVNLCFFFSSLKYKQFSITFLHLTVPFHLSTELNNLTSLKKLALKGNQIEGFKSSDVEELLRLSNLEFLDLSNNYLNRSMLSSLKGLSTLRSLNLGYNPLDGIFNLKELDGLSNLEELDLSGSKIIKFEASRADTNGLSKLRKLILDNSTTNGRSSSIQSLGAFPYLRILSIKDSEFKGKIFGEDSQDLTNLEEVFLDGSSLNDDSLQGLETLPSLKLLSLCSLSNPLNIPGLPSFKILEHLYLNFSSVDNNIWQIVSNMTSLKSLSLLACGLSGTIPVTEGLCELKHLQVLDIHFNDFNGTLPLCLANLTSLQHLDLSNNHFTGKIFPLQGLTSIQKLILSDNYFQIPISLSPLFNHSQLKYLGAENNEVYAEVEVQNLMPKFQLETLILSGPGYAGSFPKFLYYQHNLQDVQLSHIKFEGEFPCWLLENNTKLEKLYLSNSSLSGLLQLPVSSHIGLSSLDISNNGFHGQIPEGIGSSLPRLQFLKMSRNAFSGSIPSSFGNISFLQTLQLDGNQFTRNIPDSLSNCSFLEMLDVSDNHLSGEIPPGMGRSSLKVLDLSRNDLSGSLPSNFNPLQLVHIYLSENRIKGSILDAFYNCSQLITLDLSHNFLTGRIPEWIGSLPFLGYLSLSYNNLEGEIPKNICNLELLKLIDLSNNNISGHIPPCLRCTGGSGVIDPGTSNDQQPFAFTTKSYTYSYGHNILILFSGIDLSHNKLTAEIPPEFGDLMSIKVLNLSHNSLTGLIPSTFSNLSEIESLDLSYNNLVGEIPPNLTQLSSLAVFSVAHNNLSGKTPGRVAQFGTFEESSYMGNPFLCGLPLPKSCNAAISPSPLPRIFTDNNEGSGFIEMGVFYVSFLVSYIVVLLAIAAVLCINPYWRQRWFNFIEVCIRNCQYFLEDNVYVLFKFKVL